MHTYLKRTRRVNYTLVGEFSTQIVLRTPMARYADRGSETNEELDDEIVAGRYLLLEIANMPLVGPNLQLVPDADPADGWFDVMWIEGRERKALRDYLELCRRDEPAIAPAKTRRCQRVLFRYVDAPAHVDGKAFLSLAKP